MELLLFILSMSLSGILVGLVIFLLKPITRRYFSEKWQYYIWFIVMIRLILPIQLPVNFIGVLFSQSIQNDSGLETVTFNSNKLKQTMLQEIESEEKEIKQEDKKEEQLENKNDVIDSYKEEEIEQEEKPTVNRFFFQKNTILYFLPIVWLFGVLLLFLLKLMDNRNFISYLKSGNHKIENEQKLAVVDDVMMDLEIKKEIAIYENPLIISPMLVQITNPFIVLPQIEFDLEEYHYILMHELIHYKRKDLWYKWAFQLIWCIHWFNPFLFFMNQEINRNCELSCDEEVIKQLSKEEKKKYGEVLLDMADIELKFRNKVLSSSLIEKKTNLKERIVNIMKDKKNSSIIVAGSFLSIGVISLFAAVAGAKPILNTTASVESADTIQHTNLSKPFFSFIGDSIEDTIDTIGETVSNTIVSSIDDAIGSSFWNWDSFKPDMKKSGKAYKVYEDDDKIAGEDILDVCFYNSYSGRKDGSYDAKGMCLNGSNTQVIWYVNKDTTIKVNYNAKVKEGACKLVQITPDNKVVTLVEGTETKDVNIDFNQEISLKKGRNALKLVGKALTLKTASLEFSNINSSAISKYYTSEEEEQVALTLEKLKNNNYRFDLLTKKQFKDLFIYGDENEINRLLKESHSKWTSEQFKEVLPYVDEEVITTYTEQVLEEGGSFSGSELKDLFVYGDEDELSNLLVKYNYSLTEQQFREILPYIEEKAITAYAEQILKKGKSFSGSELKDLFIYGDEDELSNLLVKYNYSLTEQQFKEILPYIEEKAITAYAEQILKKGKSFSGSELKDLFIYGDEDELSDLLVKYNYSLTEQQFKEILPYIEEEFITSYMEQMLKKGRSFSDSELRDLFVYGYEDELGDVLVKYNYKLTKQQLKSILPYLEEETITYYAKQILKDGGSFSNSEWRTLFSYGDEDELLDIITKN